MLIFPLSVIFYLKITIGTPFGADAGEHGETESRVVRAVTDENHTFPTECGSKGEAFLDQERPQPLPLVGRMDRRDGAAAAELLVIGSVESEGRFLDRYVDH